MALKWVRLNIRQFDGDPGQVTVFGQSAGGHSASLLSLSPLATGLFHRAILQSWTSIAPTSVARVSDFTSLLKEAARKVGVKVSCIQQDSVSFLRCLRSKPMQEILEADISTLVESEKGQSVLMIWKPRVDGSFLLDEPQILLSKGMFADIDTMHGFCKDEFSFHIVDAENDGVNLAEFKRMIVSTLSP